MTGWTHTTEKHVAKLFDGQQATFEELTNPEQTIAVSALRIAYPTINFGNLRIFVLNFSWQRKITMGDSLKDTFETPRPQLKVWVYDDKGNRTELEATTVHILGEDTLNGGFLSIGFPLEENDGTFSIIFK